MANCILHSSFVNCCLPSSYFLLGHYTKAGTEGIRNGTSALRSHPCAAMASCACAEGKRDRKRHKNAGLERFEGLWWFGLANGPPCKCHKGWLWWSPSLQRTLVHDAAVGKVLIEVCSMFKSCVSGLAHLLMACWYFTVIAHFTLDLKNKYYFICFTVLSHWTDFNVFLDDMQRTYINGSKLTAKIIMSLQISYLWLQNSYLKVHMTHSRSCTIIFLSRLD